MCPIGLTLMFRPVIAADRNNYEKITLMKHLKNSNISLCDNVTKITAKGLIQNRQLKNLIEEFATGDNCPAEMRSEWEEARKESDMVKAKKLFGEGKILESANLGYHKAEGIMAKNYAFGEGGFAVDYVKGFDFATKAANAGDKLGQLILGYCYLYGRGVAKKYATALKWFERCEDKYPEASNNMGVIYYKGGHDVVQNLTKAVDYYRKAADQGCAFGQHNLAYMYYNGTGVNKSFVEARKFYKMSADQNYANAQFMLGKMMMKGEGGDRNRLGITLIEKASVGGIANATVYLSKTDKFLIV